MPTNAVSVTSLGVIHDLNNGEDLTVREGTLIYSLNATAVIGDEGGSITIRVNGTIMAQEDGITLTSAGANHRVIVGATGRVISLDDDGVAVAGDGAFVQNAGLIRGEFGVFLFNGIPDAGEIVNSGVIEGRTYGVGIGIGGGAGVLRNSGTVIGINGASITDSFRGGNENDRIFNTGLMVGDVELNGGNDLYVGLKGQVVGSVNGGLGNDTFRPGGSAETFVGGADIDTLDFRSGAGLTVDLNNAVVNTGRARGDSYSGIEIVLGSRKGADRLIADNALDSTLRGFGGIDTLTGGFQDDDLIGGAGKDVLKGGLGSDDYIYFKQSEMGDRVEFADVFGNDTFEIAVDAFGGGLAGVSGSLAASKFHTSTTNRAGDANDRFIFETDATRLWFDRDGSRSKFDPVLVADLQAGAVMNATDIFIFPYIL